MKRFAGREDEFLIKERRGRLIKRYKAVDDWGFLGGFKDYFIGYLNDLFGVTQTEDDYKKRLPTGGRFYIDAGISPESCTIPVEVKRGYSTILADASIAQRIALAESFYRYTERKGKDYKLEGNNSHENMSFLNGITATYVVETLKISIDPVITLFFRNKKSRYGMGYGRKDLYKLRYHIHTEYIPEREQLIASNLLLLSSILKLEEEGEPLFVSGNLGEKEVLKKVKSEGRKAKFRVLVSRNYINMSVEEMAKEWRNYIDDKLREVGSGEEIEILDAYINGDVPLEIEGEGYPEHYLDIGMEYVEKYGGDDFIRDFVERVKNFSRIDREIVEAVSDKKRVIGNGPKRIEIEALPYSWTSNAYTITFGEEEINIDLPIEKFGEFNRIIYQKKDPEEIFKQLKEFFRRSAP